MVHLNDQAVEDLLDFPYNVTDIGEFVARQGESQRGVSQVDSFVPNVGRLKKRSI
jgi:hypothetical protein